MIFSLIICTYNRKTAINNLMQSVLVQTNYPNQIIIVDGSTNQDTKNYFEENKYKNLDYFLIDQQNRGLTKQRNFGIKKVNSETEIVCFLDDDVVLYDNYFEEILKTYQSESIAIGVGGYIVNDEIWYQAPENFKPKYNQYFYDGYYKKEVLRFMIRKFLGLDANTPPGYSTNFSHGRNLGYLPPSGKTYKVEQLMGGVSSFKKEILDQHQFSTFFEGYGLYEDAEYTIRVSKFGQLFFNTAAKLNHYHDENGRPNHYNFGKMVVVNSWYIWKVKNPKPNFIDAFKWNAITLLLLFIRFCNIFTSKSKKEALLETSGRIAGYFKLMYKKPKIIN